MNLKSIALTFLVGAFGCGLLPQKKMRDDISSAQNNQQKIQVPFRAQERKMCGPTVLAMLADHHGVKTTKAHLEEITYTPGAEGTYKKDMISAARRIGMAAYLVKDFETMLSSVDQSMPVVVFQNLGVKWIPYWHYALLVGYNMEEDVLYLHSADKSNLATPYSRFLKEWRAGDSWSYTFTPAAKIPSFAQIEDVVVNGMIFEKLQRVADAESLYLAAEKKWPHRMEPKAALAQVFYSQKKVKLAIQKLNEALKLDPQSAALHFNLAHYHWDLGQKKKALELKEKTLQLAEATEKEKLRQRFSF